MSSPNDDLVAAAISLIHHAETQEDLGWTEYGRSIRALAARIEALPSLATVWEQGYAAALKRHHTSDNPYRSNQ